MAWNGYVVTEGDVVSTPQGTGVVQRVSEPNQSARVDVGGQLYDVPFEEMVKEESVPQGEPSQNPLNSNSGEPEGGEPSTSGEPGTSTTEPSGAGDEPAAEGAAMPEPQSEPQGTPDTEPDTNSKPDEFNVGDKVKVKGNGREATVSDVTQRSVKIKYTENQKTPHSYAKRTAGDKLEKIQPTPDTQDTKQDSNQEDKPDEQPEQQEPPVTTEQSKSTAQNLYGILELQKHMEQIIDEKVEDELKELREQVKTKHKLEIVANGRTVQIEGLKHQQLEQLIKYSALRLNPLLVGMAGTGKTHAGEQTAKALGLPFYAMSVGAQTSKSDIIGYMSAAGEYVQTHFRQAYEHGGVFLMDEVDAGNANVLIQINAALSNNLCAFPDMMVAKHPDFVFIASANTYGNGANRQYVGRNQLDAATLDRFAIIDWLIDDELESNLTMGLNGKAWYMAVRASRDYVAEKNIRALISPRATQKGSKLLDIGEPLEEVINATLLGSVPDDKRPDVKSVATKIFEKFASNVPSVLEPSVAAGYASKPNTQVDDLIDF